MVLCFTSVGLTWDVSVQGFGHWVNTPSYQVSGVSCIQVSRMSLVDAIPTFPCSPSGIRISLAWLDTLWILVVTAVLIPLRLRKAAMKSISYVFKESEYVTRMLCSQISITA